MAVNPLVQLGSLNRLRGSVVIPSYPSLNVTASYLSRRGIGMELTGDLTQMIDTMTGMVTSPEPFVPADITVSLLKTQPLAQLWISQMQDTTVLGNITVHTDTSTFLHFDFQNVAIMRMSRVTYDGTDPTVDFTLRGTYVLNQTLWTLA